MGVIWKQPEAGEVISLWDSSKDLKVKLEIQTTISEKGKPFRIVIKTYEGGEMGDNLRGDLSGEIRFTVAP